MPSPRAVALLLDDEEREQLQAWARRRKSAQALAQRSRIVLAAASGRNNSEIAAELGITRGMAAKWRSRFVRERLDGLLDEPRPGRPRTIRTPGRGSDRAYAGDDPEGRDALVDALDGGGAGPLAERGVADLAGVRAAATPRGDLEAVARSAVRRQGARRRRPLPRPARASGRVLRRCEVADPGARSDGADPADAAGHARARHATTTSASAPRASTPRSTSAPAR